MIALIRFLPTLLLSLGTYEVGRTVGEHHPLADERGAGVFSGPSLWVFVALLLATIGFYLSQRKRA